MKEKFINKDINRLYKEFIRMIKEANLLGIVNQKLAKQRLDRAQCVALQISALRFMN